MLEPEFLTTVRMLDKGCSDANMCASLLLGIKTILNMDRDVQWCHVVRESNSFAHGHAKCGLRVNDDLVVFHSLPPSISVAFNADVMKTLMDGVVRM